MYKRQGIVKTNSDDEVRGEVELLASADEVVRECEERLGGQRANFPRVYGETEVSQVFYENRVSSRGCVGDMVSQNGPLVFCGLPDKARRCIKDFVVPFPHSEVVQWCGDRCYDDERYFERELCVDGETELFLSLIHI